MLLWPSWSLNVIEAPGSVGRFRSQRSVLPHLQVSRSSFLCGASRRLIVLFWVGWRTRWPHSLNSGIDYIKAYDCSRVNIESPFTDKALKLCSLTFAVSRKAASVTALRVSWSGNLAVSHWLSWGHRQMARCQRHYSLVAGSKTRPQSRTLQAGTGVVRLAVVNRPNRWRLEVNTEKQREKEAAEKVTEWERIFILCWTKILPPFSVGVWAEVLRSW